MNAVQRRRFIDDAARLRARTKIDGRTGGAQTDVCPSATNTYKRDEP
jgi:hypothetical protein